LPQNPHHRFDVWEHTLAVVDGVPPEPVLRWAALLHDVAKGLPGVRCLNHRGELADHGHDRVGAEMAGKMLARLCVRPDVAYRVAWLVREHMSVPRDAGEQGGRTVRKWLIRLSGDFRTREEMKEAVRQLLALRRADRLAGKVDPDLERLEAVAGTAERVLAGMPFFAADLAVSGGDAVAAGLSGPEVGRTLEILLRRV
ncbi:MAG: HD domain-containing protein, partial [Firmicutes bacterium]|nr:HD domain-containing protein [Bacillota bacterium]